MNLKHFWQKIAHQQTGLNGVAGYKPLQSQVAEKVDNSFISSIIILWNHSIIIRTGVKDLHNRIRYFDYRIANVGSEEECQAVVLGDEFLKDREMPEIHLFKTSLKVGITIVRKDNQTRVVENLKRITNVIIYGKLAYKIGKYEMAAKQIDAHVNVHRKKLVIFVPAENKADDCCTALFATDSVVFTDKFWYDLLPTEFQSQVPIIRAIKNQTAKMPLV